MDDENSSGPSSLESSVEEDQAYLIAANDDVNVGTVENAVDDDDAETLADSGNLQIQVQLKDQVKNFTKLCLSFFLKLEKNLQGWIWANLRFFY